MKNPTFIFIFIIAVFIFGGLLYVYNPEPTEYKNPNDTGPAVCTADAKLCPDGSHVGRTGPNCEFHCPPENSCKGKIPCPGDANAPIFEGSATSGSGS
jgi:hypothetical protein